MRVALVNRFHAGDVILSRSLISRVRPLLIDIVALELRCQAKYMYLWSDLGLPLHPIGESSELDGAAVVDLWFGYQPDLLGVYGLAHPTQVVSYNRQAEIHGLPRLTDTVPMPPPVHLPLVDVHEAPGVLVENGPVLSGQRTQEVNNWIAEIARVFPTTPFYCAGPIQHRAPNLVDVSNRNLIALSSLSHVCRAMIARLSGVFVCTLTAQNRGRLPRLVVGEPIGCPIWDESDVSYFGDHGTMLQRLREIYR
jgi:hypothetical protein